MIGWLMGLFGPGEPKEEVDLVGTALETRVRALTRRNADAVSRADEVMDRELRLAYQSIVGDRRRDNQGHVPERRRVTR